MPPSCSRISIWDDIINGAMGGLQKAFSTKEILLKPDAEFLSVDSSFVQDIGVSHTLSAYRYKRVFILKNKLERRNVVRIITGFGDIGGKGCGYDFRRNNSEDFTPYNGSEPLKCELFLNDPGLRRMARDILESLAKKLGYKQVEYINMSNDPSAWYPGERPELPEARIHNV